MSPDHLVLFKRSDPARPDGDNVPYRLVQERDVARIDADEIEYEQLRWRRNGSWHASNIGSGEVMGDPMPSRPRYDEV